MNALIADRLARVTSKTFGMTKLPMIAVMNARSILRRKIENLHTGRGQ